MTAWYRGRLAAIALVLFGTSCDEPGDSSDAYQVSVDVAPWIHALGSDDLFESEPALDSLVALGPAAIPPLAAALKRETAAVRLGVIDALERLRLPESVPILIRAAEDPEELVRAEVLMALGRLGDDRATEAVESALQAPVPSVVQAAAAACESLCRSPEAIRRLVAITLFDQPRGGMVVGRGSLRVILNGRDPDRAAAAREAVAEMATPLLSSDAAPPDRARAALLIADTGDARAIPWLAELVASGKDDPLRVHAVMALGSLADPAALAALRRASEDESPLLRASACAALANLARQGVEGAGDIVSKACPY
jgi:HEAT repeat protein